MAGLEITFDMSEIHAMARKYEGGDRIVKAEATAAMTRTVIDIEQGAKRLVPVLTHNLQRSITHEVVATGGDITGRVGTNVVYAKVVEYGHPRWPNRRPRPYLNPAYQERKAAIDRELGTALMQRVMAKVGGNG